MKIKVLHIQETIASGGVERLRLSMAKKLDKNLFDQLFVGTNVSGNIPKEIEEQGFRVISIGPFNSIFHWSQHKKIQEIIEDFKPDIIHGAVFEGVTMAAINGWLKKVPVIIIEETSFPIYRSWKANLLMKLFARLADKIIGVSPTVTNEYLLKKIGLPKEKVVLVNNGVALPKVLDNAQILLLREQWGIKTTDFVVGSVGRMLSDANKRFSDIIKAFAMVSKDKNNVKLLLVGDGPERKEYEQLVSQLGIKDKVIFAGYQANVHNFYSIMDVFTLVSMHESFGLVLVEAMLNRLPVIATKVGGMKDIVDHNITGFHVQPKDIITVAEKINLLYSDVTLRNRLGLKGCEVACKKYSEEVYIKNIQNLYLSSTKRI